MPSKNFTIGHLARETGTKVPTIRYYEKIGLLPEPFRSAGNQRLYGADHIDRLAFIRHGRDLGFGLDAIRELLSLTDEPEQTCERADAIAAQHLREVENRIARLQALKAELERMLDHQCDGELADCRVIEVLADHRHCLHSDHQRID
ncbi:MAG: helix-turn-helix domain-containing protein [Magnetovibrio sp.]|nr:helix-turn-helix domain-containing protein [Magnetovibrio sp.]